MDKGYIGEKSSHADLASFIRDENRRGDTLFIDPQMFDLCDLKLRNSDGDVIKPAHAPDKSYKIKKIMNELKIPFMCRSLQPVVSTDDEVVWLLACGKSKYHIFNLNLDKSIKIKTCCCLIHKM